MIKKLTITFLIGFTFVCAAPYAALGQDNAATSSPRQARNTLIVLGQTQSQAHNHAQPTRQNRQSNTFWGRTKELFGIGEDPEAATQNQHQATNNHVQNAQNHNPQASNHQPNNQQSNAYAAPAHNTQSPQVHQGYPSQPSIARNPNAGQNLTSRPSPAMGGNRIAAASPTAPTRSGAVVNNTTPAVNNANAANPTEDRLRQLRGSIFERNPQNERRTGRGTMLIELAEEPEFDTQEDSIAALDMDSPVIGFSTSRKNDTAKSSVSKYVNEPKDSGSAASNMRKLGVISSQRPPIAKKAEETVGLPAKIEVPPVETETNALARKDKEIVVPEARTPRTSTERTLVPRSEYESEAEEATGETVATDPEPSAVETSESPESGEETDFPPEIDVNTLEKVQEENVPPKRTLVEERPAPREAELPRVAIVEVEVIEPSRNVVGQESSYAFKVINRGGVPAEHIELNLELPVWAEIQAPEYNVGSTNTIEKNEETTLLQWSLDRLDIGEEQVLHVHLIPRERKPLSIVWEYHFKQPVAQTVLEVLEPKIELSMDAPKKVLWGTTEVFSLRIQNTGNGDAEDLQITLISSDEPEKAESKPLGTIPAGEEKVLNIEFFAKHDETLKITTKIDGPYGIHAEHTQEIDILRAKLETRIEASEMQFVGNENEYRIIVQNQGSAPAENVEIKATLPAGAKYVSNEGNGEIASAHSNQVIWKIETIPAGEEFVCVLACELRRDGMNKLDLIARDATGLSSTTSAQTMVESIANLAMKIQNPNDPVEVGKLAVHSIRITNRGSKPAENVDIIAAFSEGVIPEKVEGGKATIFNDPHDDRSGQVYFETIPRIGARQAVELKIYAKSVVPGNQKIRVEMICDATDTHLINEDAMRYYSSNKGVQTMQRTVKNTEAAKSNGNEKTPERLALGNSNIPSRSNPFRKESEPKSVPTPIEKPILPVPEKEKTEKAPAPPVSVPLPVKSEAAAEEPELNLPPLDDLDFFSFDEPDLNLDTPATSASGVEKKEVDVTKITPVKNEAVKNESESRETILKNVRKLKPDTPRNNISSTLKLSEKITPLKSSPAPTK